VHYRLELSPGIWKSFMEMRLVEAVPVPYSTVCSDNFLVFQMYRISIVT
jgi:hypothetical protein